MIGEILLRSLTNGDIKFNNASEFNDFEREYRILLESRNVRLDAIPDFEEQLTLAVLCRFTWPGKPDSYKRDVENFLKQFEGISVNQQLQRVFRKSITRKFSTAKAPNFYFSEVSDVFHATGINR
jgi:hypothetical protein